MRDELRERLATVVRCLARGNLPEAVADHLLTELEAFMREHDCKMVKREPSDGQIRAVFGPWLNEGVHGDRRQALKDGHDAALLTPWEGKVG
jgi:hypothetical protein